MFKIDSKVKLTTSLLAAYEGKTSAATGTVVGYAHKREEPMVLVELDQGFYNADETIFVSVLLVHPTSITPID